MDAEERKASMRLVNGIKQRCWMHQKENFFYLRTKKSLENLERIQLLKTRIIFFKSLVSYWRQLGKAQWKSVCYKQTLHSKPDERSGYSYCLEHSPPSSPAGCSLVRDQSSGQGPEVRTFVMIPAGFSWAHHRNVFTPTVGTKPQSSFTEKLDH